MPLIGMRRQITFHDAFLRGDSQHAAAQLDDAMPLAKQLRVQRLVLARRAVTLVRG